MFKSQINNELLVSLRAVYQCLQCEIDFLKDSNIPNDVSLRNVIAHYENMSAEVNIMYELIRALEDI